MGKLCTTAVWEQQTRGKPQPVIPIWSLVSIGLVWWSLGAGPVRAQEKPAGKKAVTVDIHCHISTPEVEPLVKGLLTPEKEPFFRFATAETLQINQQRFAALVPKLTEPEERLKDMDRMGIAIQAISPGPNQFYYWTDGELGLKIARLQNDRVAEIVRAHPDRFVG
ncbi:MAG: amidohydrolase family protein, partial [Deltaproteobacteria bacterium]|nr:amidohydrolase family protein [Deltaproteobacteria bacterium]